MPARFLLCGALPDAHEGQSIRFMDDDVRIFEGVPPWKSQKP
jgi:hypothetical protein